MDPPRSAPPVAVRVIRPFATEDDLLAAEASAFTRTGVVLVGAPSRPNGVVLRFEICLRDGTAVMRGEGRVVGFRASSSEDESALMMRFTRLDLKSKALLDRAVALREERRSVAPPKPPSSVAPTTERDSISAPRASAPPPSAPRISAPPVSAPPPVVVAPVSASSPDDVRSIDVNVDDDDDAMDVDDADLTSADDDDQTVQAPPVAMIADMRAAGPAPKEKAPLPQPSPAAVPAPKPIAPLPQAPPQRAPEHAPPPQQAPAERMPVPTRSPNDKQHVAEVVARVRNSRTSGEFRPSLAPDQRDSALDRLRKRPSRV
jgi:hypothetical protein